MSELSGFGPRWNDLVSAGGRGVGDAAETPKHMERDEVRRDRLLVIVGQTAVGKTEMALRLAERLPIEVISADSRQVYRLMDIGTAKPAPAQLAEVRHHLIDVVT